MNPLIEGAYIKLTSLGLNVEGAANLFQGVSRSGRIDSEELSIILAAGTLGAIIGVTHGVLSFKAAESNAGYRIMILPALWALSLGGAAAIHTLGD